MDFYEDISSVYDNLAWADEREQKEKNFFEHIFSKHGGFEKVLDCACGTGNHLILLDEEFGISGTGSDISGSMLEKARKKAEERGLDTSFYQVNFL